MTTDNIMIATEEEKEAVATEEGELAELDLIVTSEIDRQVWRGEMFRKSFELSSALRSNIQDMASAEQGIAQPLPPIARDPAFQQGGWIASTAQQRREKALDGGSAVSKLRIFKKK